MQMVNGKNKNRKKKRKDHHSLTIFVCPKPLVLYTTASFLLDASQSYQRLLLIGGQSLTAFTGRKTKKYFTTIHALSRNCL